MDRKATRVLRIGLALGVALLTASFHQLDPQVLRDDSPPMVSLGISQPTGNNGWYNAPVSVTVKAYDSGSGLVSREVSIGGKVWYANGLVVKEDGTFRVYGRATDRAGNTTTTSMVINVDMTKPELRMTIPDPRGYENWHVNSVPVRISGSDALSGMAETHLLIKGDSILEEISPEDDLEAYDLEEVRTYQQLITGSNNVQDSQALIDESGIYTINGYVEDLAGNRTLIEKVIQVDMTPPQVEINSPKKFFGKITIDGSLLDYDSGVRQLFVDIGDGWSIVKPDEASVWELDWVTDNLKDGKYLIKARVEDAAGNQNFAYYTVTVLNNIWPVFTFIGVLLSIGLLAMYDPRRIAWRQFSTTLGKIARMEKSAMLLREELK